MLGNEQRSRCTPKRDLRKRDDWLAEPYKPKVAAMLAGLPVLEPHHAGCRLEKIFQEDTKSHFLPHNVSEQN